MKPCSSPLVLSHDKNVNFEGQQKWVAQTLYLTDIHKACLIVFFYKETYFNPFENIHFQLHMSHKFPFKLTQFNLNAMHLAHTPVKFHNAICSAFVSPNVLG